jgi:hypothetical protein
MEPPPKTRVEAAEIIARIIGKPVSATLVRNAIARHPEWVAPPGSPGLRPVMEYECERALGPIKPEHKKAWDWIMLTAYERGKAGLMVRQAATPDNAEGYVAKRRRLGLVTDYTPSGGFFTRVALPWEREVRSYLRLPQPEYARLEVETALADPELLPEVRAQWADWLTLDRAAYGRLKANEKG